MNDTKNPAAGIYFNSADSPVFLEGEHIGGHDYVYLKGDFRIPGHFVRITDPVEDSEAPETYRRAYAQMAEAERPSAPQDVPSEPAEDAEEPKPRPKPTKTSRTRKGGSDTSSSDAASQ